MSRELERPLRVAFVTGASGAGKTTTLKLQNGEGSETATVVSLDGVIKQIATALDSKVHAENRRFASDCFNYSQWERFLISSTNFENAVKEFRAVLKPGSMRDRIIEGNHFFLPRFEETVLMAVLRNPDWRARDIVIRKFLLDCDPLLVFKQLARDNRPKLIGDINHDVQRFRDVMPNRGYEPHHHNTLAAAVDQFLRGN